MKTLIIPCGGQSLRMKKYYFPKCLLPVKQRPILFEIINYWKDLIDEVIIVLNRESGDMIKEYLKKYFDKTLNIKFCYQEKKSGTYFAIKKAIQMSKNDFHILNWSDILPLRSMPTELKSSVFITQRIPCRWKFNGKFVNMGEGKVSEGGIFGIFFLDKMKESFLEDEEESEGETEILEKLNPDKFEKVEFEDFIDIGDLEKYNQDVRVSDKVRAFGSSNELIFTEEEVIKKTAGEKLSRCEQNWYKNANFEFIPKIKGYDPLVLERIKNSQTLGDYLEKNPEQETWVIKQVFEILKKIHTSKKEEDAIFEDSFDQYYGKTIKRLEKIDFLFNGFEDKIIINGKHYENPLKLLVKNKEKIESIFAEKFYFIHGDLQLSNILIDENKKLYVIDPRGYFGNNDLFGDCMYDFAKLYYGFCGMWNEFSRGFGEVEYKKETDEFEIKPLLEKSSLERRRTLFFKESEKIEYTKITKEKIDIIHAIIWLSVADYISNDVLSSLYGYLNGTILINNLFS